MTKKINNNKNKNIRDFALDIIINVMENGAYSDKALHNVLDSGTITEKRDRAFLSRLCEGTVERVILLDYIIDCFSSVKAHKMKPVIRNVMRMSVYQIFYMEQVIDAAACNEAVKLTIKRGFKGLSGFVNGVLRNIIRKKDSIIYPSITDGFNKYASIKYSMPEWIVEELRTEYGKEIAEKILKSFLSENKCICVRCNLSKASTIKIEEMLKADGVTVNRGNFFDYALNISDYNKITELKAFKDGFIQVQDESSMLTVAISRIKENDTVIDICAAPGGKTLQASDVLNGTGLVISCDISESKIKFIHENIKRAGFKNIDIYKNNALIYKDDWREIADVVIADLPCSGLGVMGRKCDIKYKTKPSDIDDLTTIQREMLKIASQYVKLGGRLIYSTCTITQAENIENFEWIKNNLPFKSESIEELLPEKLKGKTGKNGFIQVLPHMAGTDGYFAASFVKY